MKVAAGRTDRLDPSWPASRAEGMESVEPPPAFDRDPARERQQTARTPYAPRARRNSSFYLVVTLRKNSRVRSFCGAEKI
jgi:hypothetical protein